jgi:hypothetical protein
MSGVKLAALFGFYPNKLGFCGLQKNSAKSSLLKYLTGKKVSEQKIRKILETFKGAFAYYKLIAKSNKIEDPFNEKVVRAYWIGNELLERVPVVSLKEMIVKEFSGPGFLSREIVEKKSKKVSFPAKPHHSFHVLVLGSVTGSVELKGKLLDFCRVGSGEVIEHEKTERKKLNRIVIKYQPLQEREKRYSIGKPVSKVVFWDRRFVPKIKMGDKVAIHWNHIIELLDNRDLVNLKKYTQTTIDSLNG